MSVGHEVVDRDDLDHNDHRAQTAADSRLPTDAPNTPPTIDLTASTATIGQHLLAGRR